MDVSTAVILAAGSGTRRYPITRAIDKAMLPLGNRPTVDYVVEQCARAGLTQIIFVVSRQDTQIKRYYGTSIDVVREYPWLELSGTINLTYTVQKNPDGLYGTGAALLTAEHLLKKDETFIVLAADGFVYSKEDYISAMIDAKGDAESGSVVGLLLDGDEARSYGLIHKDERDTLISIIEKPTDLKKSQEYPTYITYCMLHTSIFPYIKKTELENGELYLPTAIVHWAKEHSVKVVPVHGEYLDSGRLDSWIEANNFLFGT